MKITTKGQVTIPQDIREQLGLFPHSEVEFVIKGKRAYLHKISRENIRGQAIIQRMRGKGNLKMSTDQIMALTRGK